MQEELQVGPNWFKTVLNYGKRYLYRTIFEILKEWSLDDVIEDSGFQRN